MAIASKNSRMDKAARGLGTVRGRFAEMAVPRLPLSAILGFAIVGFGGALFLAYSRFSSADAITSGRVPDEVPVYSARAVPLDPEPARIAEEPVARLRAAATTQATEAQTVRTQKTELLQTVAGASSESLFASSERGDLKGLNNFAPDFSMPNVYLSMARANPAIGITAQTNSPGDMAPDAATETVSVVPESSTWLCGAGLIALVGARFIRSRLRRARSRPPRS
jgi:hypothetical protein